MTEGWYEHNANDVRSKCKLGDLEAVRLNLIEHNIAIDDMGYLDALVRVAAQYGHLHIVKFLMEEYKSDDYHAVAYYACERGNLDIFSYIVHNYRRHIYTNNWISMAANNGHPHIVKYLIEQQLTSIPETIFYVICYKKYEIAKQIAELYPMELCKCDMRDLYVLLNLGVDYKLLGNAIKPYVKARDERNLKISEILFNHTELCLDIIDTVCLFTEY